MQANFRSLFEGKIDVRMYNMHAYFYTRQWKRARCGVTTFPLCCNKQVVLQSRLLWVRLEGEFAGGRVSGGRWWMSEHDRGVYLIIINNNNNSTTMFMVLSSWPCHCKSSPGSFDECRLSAGWPPTLRPSQPTWALSPPIKYGFYHPHPPSPFVIITQPESW